MTELCVRGVRYRLSFGFLIMLAVLCCTGRTFAAYAFACLTHELGHLLCMTLLGVRVSAVTFAAGGILIEPARERLLPISKELPVLLSGAGVNLLLGLLFLQLGARDAAAVQIVVGVWNLLPSSSLDGGAVLRCCTERLFGWCRAQQWICIGSGVCFLILTAVCARLHIGGRLLCAALLWIGGSELAKGAGM